MQRPLFGPASGDIWDDFIREQIANNNFLQRRNNELRAQFIAELNRIGVTNRASIKQALLVAGVSVLGGTSIAKSIVTRTSRAWDNVVKSVYDSLPASLDSKKPRLEGDPGQQPFGKNLRGAEVTPPQKKRGTVEVGISPDGNVEAQQPILRAPPGANAARRAITMSAPEQMDTGTGGGENNSGDPRLNMNQITKVSRFPYAYEGIPKQYTTIMPFRALLANSVGVDNASGNKIYYVRMESIFDIIKSDGNAYSANPNVVADSADSTAPVIRQKPYWRDYWLQFYEYWTVVETRVKISAWCSAEVSNRGCAMYWGYTGLQKVPQYQDGSTTAWLKEIDYDRMKGFQKIFLMPNGGSGAGRHIMQTNKTITFTYHKGDGVHEVAEDELIQTWIKGDNVPKEQNNLTIILAEPSRISGLTSGINVEIEIEYVVQMKDLKAIYQFPTPGAFTGFNQVVS